MRSKSAGIALAGMFVVVLLAGSFTTGFLVGNQFVPYFGSLRGEEPRLANGYELDTRPRIEAAEQAATAAETPLDLEPLFVPFWEAWNIVHEEFVDQPVDDQALMRGAIQGMMESLDDPYTSYLTPQALFQLNSSLEGQYQGIGAWVDTTNEYVTIISPMPGSPAEEAGLQPGDQIIAIDGEDMTGLEGSVVISKVLGPEGTTIVLTVRREDEPDLFDVEVRRANIVIPGVISEMLESDIGYVQLTQFANETPEELRQALEELMDAGAQGLILDLRNNGGGLLSSAIEISSEFIGEGVLLYQEYGDGSRETHNAISGGIATQIPIVVLINNGSASASEILAGAIQDYGRGLLVGVTTFGKGSVQLPITLSDDQGAVRVTIARWLTPNERQINELGIEPDIEVIPTELELEAGTDVQLERAIELLRS